MQQIEEYSFHLVCFLMLWYFFSNIVSGHCGAFPCGRRTAVVACALLAVNTGIWPTHWKRWSEFEKIISCYVMYISTGETQIVVIYPTCYMDSLHRFSDLLPAFGILMPLPRCTSADLYLCEPQNNSLWNLTGLCNCQGRRNNKLGWKWQAVGSSVFCSFRRQKDASQRKYLRSLFSLQLYYQHARHPDIWSESGRTMHAEVFMKFLLFPGFILDFVCIIILLRLLATIFKDMRRKVVTLFYLIIPREVFICTFAYQVKWKLWNSNMKEFHCLFHIALVHWHLTKYYFCLCLAMDNSVVYSLL